MQGSAGEGVTCGKSAAGDTAATESTLDVAGGAVATGAAAAAEEEEEEEEEEGRGAEGRFKLRPRCEKAEEEGAAELGASILRCAAGAAAVAGEARAG